jgi:hypothetical protein
MEAVMSITPSVPPPDAISNLESGLGQIRTAPGGQPAAFAGMLSSVDEPHWADGLPHQAFNLGLDAITAGKGLEGAKPVGWRFLLGQPSQDPAVAAEVEGSLGQHNFSGLNRGPFVAQTLKAMRLAENDPRVSDGDFEPRFLRVPALYVVALWLKERNSGNDLVIPLEPAPPNLAPGRIYTGLEFTHELETQARQLVPPAAGTAQKGPSAP